MKRPRRLRPPHRGSGRPTAAGIVLAGGSGTRLGAEVNKAFLPLGGRSITAWGLEAMLRCPGVAPVILVIRPEDRDRVEQMLEHEVADGHRAEVVHGGPTRQASELAALDALDGRIGCGAVDVALLHDAARPLVSVALVERVLERARAVGGALPALPAPGIVRTADGGRTASGDGLAEELVRVQTPQGFRAPELLAAYRQAAADGFVGTDTASCAERYTDLEAVWVRGEETNFKVTYASDLLLAQDVVASWGFRSGGGAA